MTTTYRLPIVAPARLLADYRTVRARTEELCAPLEPDDMVVQTMPDVSPTKWHLAHVTWFFETMVLMPHAPGYRPFDARFGTLFNSYYQALGQPFPRGRRGALTRPTVEQVLAYRQHVDAAIADLLTQLDGGDHGDGAEIAKLLTVGLHHEQQHQELLLMDVLNVLASNPLRPAYDVEPPPPPPAGTVSWRAFDGGDAEIGHAGAGFCYDNEQPRHAVRLTPFALASRLVTNGEWLEFVADGGYRRSELWLADGWERVQHEGLTAPLYWEQHDGDWFHTTLHGFHPVHPDERVCHVSFYEAEAFARWRECRLPTEFEWEHAAASGQLEQVDDEVWQWTRSSYAPYPGYRPFQGALAEYNGKFMVNQQVLRGGCFATPPDHARRTYRNFYHPHQRWMFAGLRLARDPN
ncbi:MAG: ergothioneine biosynthesis protein EgtB [Planctomycetes bacterium]|nr:ergothioneine biosynthesis protein EgtB [Planctomycetota bacterium]